MKNPWMTQGPRQHSGSLYRHLFSLVLGTGHLECKITRPRTRHEIMNTVYTLYRILVTVPPSSSCLSPIHYTSEPHTSFTRYFEYRQTRHHKTIERHTSGPPHPTINSHTRDFGLRIQVRRGEYSTQWARRWGNWRDLNRRNKPFTTIIIAEGPSQY